MKQFDVVKLSLWCNFRLERLLLSLATLVCGLNWFLVSSDGHLGASVGALFALNVAVALTHCFVLKSDAFDVDFVTSRVKFYERIASFCSDAFKTRTKIFEFEMRARHRTLVLLVLVVEVDSLVVVQIDHFFLWSLLVALALPT